MENIISRVKQELAHAESGHDFNHIERVLNLANKIAADEQNLGREVNLQIVQLGALLHDIADQKFHGGDDNIGPQKARQILESEGVDINVIEAVEDIIRTISFKGAKVKSQMKTLEGQIVQDADRIDALGAIGVARAFTYGGFRGRVLYSPNEEPKLHQSYEDYKKSESSTINHFYEKLFLLKDLMNTETGRKIAEKRHQYMVEFVEQFKKEWAGLV